MSSPLVEHWDLDPTVTHLNHGSFGATPHAVLARQTRWQRQIEANPVRFFARDLARHLDASRAALATFLNTDPALLAFVPNASTGVNAVLRSLDFAPGDELLVTDHGYGAASNAADYVAARSGARLITAHVPGAPQSAADILTPLLDATSPRTRLALIDHVTSATALVFPIAEIVARLKARGIPTLVDGAHAPGMLDVNLAAIGAAYYVGNCHKWMCAPKGAGFLSVGNAGDAEALVPVVVGWGRTVRPEGRSQFHSHFDWVGTSDPSPFLSVPTAITTMGALLPGGWPELRRHNHDLVVVAQQILCERLGVQVPAPAALLGSMATVPLPDGDAPASALAPDPLQERLADAGFEIPVTRGPGPMERWLRVSAQAYNSIDDYSRLAQLL